jgi:hypothetical protein
MPGHFLKVGHQNIILIAHKLSHKGSFLFFSFVAALFLLAACSHSPNSGHQFGTLIFRDVREAVTSSFQAME